MSSSLFRTGVVTQSQKLTIESSLSKCICSFNRAYIKKNKQQINSFPKMSNIKTNWLWNIFPRNKFLIHNKYCGIAIDVDLSNESISAGQTGKLWHLNFSIVFDVQSFLFLIFVQFGKGCNAPFYSLFFPPLRVMLFVERSWQFS
jgi:hypothetical protein